MSKDRYIFAVDVGTSSLKAALMDRELRIIKQDRIDYVYRVLPNRGVEIDPEIIWRALVKVCRRFSPYGERIGVMALCVFCPALTPMDREGSALRSSIIHLDRRSFAQARRAVEQFGEERFLKITGNLPFPGGVSLNALLWLQEHEEKVFQAAYRFGHLNTFLMKRLVNRWLIDPTNASMTGLYETVAYGGWSEELTRAFTIPESRLPEVVDCDQVVGVLTPEAARHLQVRPGTPLIMGGGDTACAAYGAGGEEEGEILNIAGSSELLTVTLKKPYPSKRYNLRTHVLKDRWLIFVITVSGIALEWFREQFCREMDKDSFYEGYLPEVLREGRTEETFHPYLCGDRYSLFQRRGSFRGLTLSTTREDMLRAMTSGFMKPMHDTLIECQKRIRLREPIVLTGGGANETIKHYKEKQIFSGKSIILKNDCSLVGVAKLARRHLD